MHTIHELSLTFCVQGVVSPVLANVFLHYVLDLWFHKIMAPERPGWRSDHRPLR